MQLIPKTISSQALLHTAGCGAAAAAGPCAAPGLGLGLGRWGVFGKGAGACPGRAVVPAVLGSQTSAAVVANRLGGVTEVRGELRVGRVRK